MSLDSVGFARRLVGAYVTACDPDALVSASTYRMSEPAHRALYRALLSYPWSDASIAGGLGRLGRIPRDATAHWRLTAALAAELAHDDVAAARMRDRLEEVEKISYVRYHLGDAYDMGAAAGDNRLDTPDAVRELLASGPFAGVMSPPPEKEDLATAVVVPIRARPSDHGRARNAVASVASVADQTLPRSRYRIVVVEQDVAPRLRAQLADLVDDYLFVVNPGPFNKSWALNLGAAAVPEARTLCLHDADMVVEPDHLASVVAALEDGPPALLPYGDLLFLDQDSSTRAIASRFGGLGRSAPETLRGFALRDVGGGYVCVTRALFDDIGGYDERYRGWGDEDDEFYEQMLRRTVVPRWDRLLPHLWHRRPVMVNAEGRRANEDLAGVPRQPGQIVTADPLKYAHEAVAPDNVHTDSAPEG